MMITKKTKKETVKESVKVVSKQNGSWSTVNVIAVIITLVIVGLVGMGFDKVNQNRTANDTVKEVAAVSAIAYDGEDGKTALDLLKTRATIETQDSSIGIFVVAINGMTNSDSQYWMFYVNGELAPVAADQYASKNGDKIEWRYETFQ